MVKVLKEIDQNSSELELENIFTELLKFIANAVYLKLHRIKGMLLSNYQIENAEHVHILDDMVEASERAIHESVEAPNGSMLRAKLHDVLTRPGGFDRAYAMDHCKVIYATISSSGGSVLQEMKYVLHDLILIPKDKIELWVSAHRLTSIPLVPVQEDFFHIHGKYCYLTKPITSEEIWYHHVLDHVEQKIVTLLERFDEDCNRILAILRPSQKWAAELIHSVQEYLPVEMKKLMKASRNGPELALHEYTSLDDCLSDVNQAVETAYADVIGKAREAVNIAVGRLRSAVFRVSGSNRITRTDPV